jgi:hypothetical protein
MFERRIRNQEELFPIFVKHVDSVNDEELTLRKYHPVHTYITHAAAQQFPLINDWTFTKDAMIFRLQKMQMKNS